MEILLTLLERFGLPVAFLALTIWDRIRLLREKDRQLDELRGEVMRLHEARLTAATDHGERLLTAAQEAHSLVDETNQTLSALASQVTEWRQDMRERR